ncbi:formiminoglutamase protein [Glycocaulis alkaliphilus]|uniref:Formiminoglutamase protein n=1 Tax=Glycocaulis alkaliphilus TaxID=1434191 RepID=A0A3T0EB66_9PROT|nr:N-formylglutamate deformylase [Glycocaulis alkaliphilus]AZU04447.1 formiminoglutamase protein [Glycocaulis alkaliphilus]GGB78438.1 N-formylglutamate deformylase [Glycocaulis alkaliphilus]
MNPVSVRQGTSPVVIAVPHAGTWLPEKVRARLNAKGEALADTDWHVDRLYEGLLPGAAMVVANFHRYVVDPNRPPNGASLYPGQNTTGLVANTDFDGEPIWTEPPTTDEIAARVAAYHAPYHAAVAAALDAAKARHGVAILYDAHSIRSRIPFLFDGTLPDLCIGTADGTSCAEVLSGEVIKIASKSARYSHVLNGRFKGGWTTRHYGKPDTGVHAIQMELAQSAYLQSETAPFAYDDAKATSLRAVLSEILHRLEELAPDLKVTS